MEVMSPRIQFGKANLVNKECDYKQRDNIQYFNHRVYGRTSCILVRITDGVAGNGGFVGVRTLATKGALLNILFGIIPRAAAGCHRNGDEEASHNGADEKTAQSNRTENKTDDDGGQNRNEGRNNH